jgi:integrase
MGARRDEARCIEWREIAADGQSWTIPKERNKSERDFEMPLSTQMVALLDEVRRIGKRFVFTVTGEHAWSGHGKFKAALDKVAGVSGWTLHDLRRTVRTRLSSLVRPDIAERLLNHVVGSRVERSYDRATYLQEKTQAAQAWANCLIAIVGEGADNVEQFIRRA